MHYQIAEKCEGVCINLATFAALSEKEFSLTRGRKLRSKVVVSESGVGDMCAFELQLGNSALTMPPSSGVYMQKA